MLDRVRPGILQCRLLGRKWGGTSKSILIVHVRRSFVPENVKNSSFIYVGFDVF